MTKVAVVEDDEAILDSVTLVLESRGWEVGGYSRGESFVADFSAGQRWDCLVLDPHLPAMTGADVAAAIAGSGIPIVVLTARPDSPLTQSMIQAGIAKIITKPVDAAVLMDAILAALLGAVGAG